MVVGGEPRIRQRAGGQHRQPGAVTGRFVKIARIFLALRLCAARSERVAEAAQAFARIDIQRRTIDEGDAAVPGT